MKKVTFLVAFLALLQAISGAQIAQAQRIQQENDRHPSQEAMESAGNDIEEKIRGILKQLDLPSDQLGESFERWAEENSGDLQAWSEEYGPQWQSWSDRFEKKMARFASDQQEPWSQWFRGYERNLNQWMSDIDSDDLDPSQVGELIERNLKLLSKMPLGQFVDQALHDGLGELSGAPWESLGELAHLAQHAFEQPLNELKDARDAAARESAIERVHQQQFLEKIEREKSLQAEKLKLFNDDLRDSADQASRANAETRRRDARNTKRVDGRNLDSNARPGQPSQRESTLRLQRDKQPGRAPANRRRAQSRSSKTNPEATDDIDEEEMLKLMRLELEKIRAEIEQLKKDKSDK